MRNFRECRDTNPGRLGEKRERYLCAMPFPHYSWLEMPTIIQKNSFLNLFWLFWDDKAIRFRILKTHVTNLWKKWLKRFHFWEGEINLENFSPGIKEMWNKCEVTFFCLFCNLVSSRGLNPWPSEATTWELLYSFRLSISLFTLSLSLFLFLSHSLTLSHLFLFHQSCLEFLVLRNFVEREKSSSLLRTSFCYAQ